MTLGLFEGVRLPSMCLEGGRVNGPGRWEAVLTWGRGHDQKEERAGQSSWRD